MNDNTDDQHPEEFSLEVFLRDLTVEERRLWFLQGFGELPPVLSVEDAGRLLGIAKSTCYAWVNSQRLGSLLIGGCRRIPRYFLFIFVVKHLQYPLT